MLNTVKGTVTYIAHNRTRTATKIRIGSRKWILIKYINLDDQQIKEIIGSQMIFHGKWKETPSYGKMFFADSYDICSPPAREKILLKLRNFIEKKGTAIKEIKFLALESVLSSLFLMGKKSLLKKFMGWTEKKQNKYFFNPYLFYLNRHLDFYSAETLASVKKIPCQSKEKIQALIYKALEDSYKNSVESLSISKLKENVEQAFYGDISEDDFLESVKSVKKVVMDGENVFLSRIYFLKKKTLNKLIQYTGDSIWDMIKDREEQESGVISADLKELLRHKWCVLTGGAGTGKTTFLRKLADLKSINVIFSATTGKAAQILSEQAVTVHHLLGYRQGSFSIEKLDDCDLLVVDESSMLDWHTLHAVVRAAPRVIFAGDPGQLPPVHGESVFKEIMKIIPVIELEKNWRFNGGQQSNVEFIKRPDKLSILSTIKTLAAVLNRNGDSFQVLTPIKSSFLGVDTLNKSMQNIINAGSQVIGKKNYFRIGDKVIAKQNVYIDGERLISNGETGTIKAERSGYIVVEFSDGNDILVEENDIDLAYALTVHKAQGSEYDYVIFVVPPDVDKDFVTEELTFVAKTRGRKKTYVVSYENQAKETSNSNSNVVLRS